MVPLYTEERDLEASKGIAALFAAFDKHDVDTVVDVERPNAAAQARKRR